MEFVVKKREKYEPVERWEGTIEIFDARKDVVQAVVQGRGSTFTIIFGSYEYGNFLCIPEINVGCPLADWNDLFWNRERLAGLMNPIDAITVVGGIAALMDERKGEHEYIFYC